MPTRCGGTSTNMPHSSVGGPSIGTARAAPAVTLPYAPTLKTSSRTEHGPVSAASISGFMRGVISSTKCWKAASRAGSSVCVVMAM